MHGSWAEATHLALRNGLFHFLDLDLTETLDLVQSLPGGTVDRLSSTVSNTVGILEYSVSSQRQSSSLRS